MKKKRNLYIIAFLCFITLVGVTIAYLQSTDTFENIFKAGTYRVVTHEEFTSPDNWKPGDITPKTITTKNEGTIPVRVRVKLDESWTSSFNDNLPLQFKLLINHVYYFRAVSIIDLDNENDWIYKGGYYYYLHELLPGEETTSLIKSVTFNPEYNGNVTCNYNSTTNSNECSSSDEYMGGTYTLNITTETLQSDAYETLWDNVPIIYDYVGDNPCTYDGELVPGAEFVDGQYTYRYRQESTSSTKWQATSDDGWGVKISDYQSIDPVTTTLCSSINNKPIVSMKNMFSKSKSTSIDLSSFDTSNVTDMMRMFYSSKTENLDVSNFDTSKVNDMDGMFFGSQATSLNLSNFDTSKVTNMNAMFEESMATLIDVSSFDTSNVTDISDMFSVSKVTSLDLSNFNTSKVTDMAGMFYNCKVQNLNISSFDTSKVTNMSGMFRGIPVTQIDLSNFNTSNVIMMNRMFSYSKINSLDLSSFDMSNVTSVEGMFEYSTTTTGYARTQADADKLNTSSNKPSALTFVVKNS